MSTRIRGLATVALLLATAPLLQAAPEAKAPAPANAASHPDARSSAALHFLPDMPEVAGDVGVVGSRYDGINTLQKALNHYKNGGAGGYWRATRLLLR